MDPIILPLARRRITLNSNLLNSPWKKGDLVSYLTHLEGLVNIYKAKIVTIMIVEN